MILATVFGSQPCFSETALQRAAIELTSRTNVLTIAVRPGAEDLAAIAYFKQVKGANVTTLYLTNGEAGESDVQGLFPRELASVRRREAVAAMKCFDGGTVFLNFPDIVAANTDSAVLRSWPVDSIQMALVHAFTRFKPDVVLLSSDRFVASRPRWHFLLEKWIKTAIAIAGSQVTADRWEVDRFLVETLPPARKSIPLAANKSLQPGRLSTGVRAAEEYSSLRVQRRIWQKRGDSKYVPVLQRSTNYLRSADQGLPGAPPRRLSGLDARIEKLAASFSTKRVSTARYLTLATALADSMNQILLRDYLLTTREKRDALMWKQGLENIRNLLLGVSVTYHFSESVLTGRQLLFLRVDSLTGVSKGGTTELYVPGVAQGWILEEASASRVPLVIGKSYNLISPMSTEYDIPYHEEGLERNSIGHPLYVFLIHKAQTREQSFSYRIVYPLLYAPRFTVEVQTPIVAMVPGEKIRLLVTNHSRDGVKDQVYISDSIAFSSPVEFSLPSKEASQIVELQPQWKFPTVGGTFTSSILISGEPVVRVGYRTLPVLADTAKKVSLVTGIAGSPLLISLNRMRFSHVDAVTPDDAITSVIGPDVLLLDRRALTYSREVSTRANEYLDFAKKGGHLIVCAQDPIIWNSTVLGTTLRLDERAVLDPATDFTYSLGDSMLAGPNPLAGDEHRGFLFQLNHNVVAPGDSGSHLLVSSTGATLGTSIRVGKGRITYLGLALGAQILNVNPWIHMFLANLISSPVGSQAR